MTGAEIHMTTVFNRADSERIAAEMSKGPDALAPMLRAMLKVGLYSADEIVERTRALRVIAKK